MSCQIKKKSVNFLAKRDDYLIKEILDFSPLHRFQLDFFVHVCVFENLLKTITWNILYYSLL